MHVPVSTSPIFWCRKRKRIERKTRMIKTKRREKQNRMKGMLKDMTETKTKINVTKMKIIVTKKMIETMIVQIHLNIAATPAVIARKRYASIMLFHAVKLHSLKYSYTSSTCTITSYKIPNNMYMTRKCWQWLYGWLHLVCDSEVKVMQF